MHHLLHRRAKATSTPRTRRAVPGPRRSACCRSQAGAAAGGTRNGHPGAGRLVAHARVSASKPRAPRRAALPRARPGPAAALSPPPSVSLGWQAALPHPPLRRFYRASGMTPRAQSGPDRSGAVSGPRRGERERRRSEDGAEARRMAAGPKRRPYSPVRQDGGKGRGRAPARDYGKAMSAEWRARRPTRSRETRHPIRKAPRAELGHPHW